MDLIGNPYHVDEKHNLVVDTEYDYFTLPCFPLQVPCDEVQCTRTLP